MDVASMLELGTRHATLEARCDLEGTMATATFDIDLSVNAASCLPRSAIA